MTKFIKKEVLDKISYRSSLEQSLKQISLSNTPLELILADVNRYRMEYTDIVMQENLIGSRFKSDDSIKKKYEKTIRTRGGFKQCFNDVLGFRLHMAEYPVDFPDYFRVVDLRNGKKNDDGYRAIHLYYQRDNLAYPIEIQLWCAEDYAFNVWSHKMVYKYESTKVGRLLYEKYETGLIQSEEQFVEELIKLRLAQKEES